MTTDKEISESMQWAIEAEKAVNRLVMQGSISLNEPGLYASTILSLLLQPRFPGSKHVLELVNATFRENEIIASLANAKYEKRKGTRQRPINHDHLTVIK